MPNWLSKAFHFKDSKESRSSVESSSLQIGARRTPDPPNVNHNHVNAVYYANWKVYKGETPATLNLDYISHVFYAFAVPNAQGGISLSDEWADTQIQVDGTDGCIPALMNLKSRHPDLKVILSIGGADASSRFAQIASNNQSRLIFTRSVRQLVDTHRFDGIDIDWEHPSTSTEGINFSHLLSTLRTYLPSPTYTLISAWPATRSALSNLPLPSASHPLDYINLMTYDFAGSWSSHSGHHAQLHTPKNIKTDSASVSCSEAVEYLLSQGVPASKIVLGIPAYGRSFVGAKKVGQGFRGCAGEEGTFEYKDLLREGGKEGFDGEVGAAWCVGGEAGWVSFDSVESVRMKGQWARGRGLAGLFYWIGTGDVKGPKSLVEAGYGALCS